MTPVIHPCPFCGCTDVVVDEPTPLSYAVGCPECNSTGPRCSTFSGAILVWNRINRCEPNEDEVPT